MPYRISDFSGTIFYSWFIILLLYKNVNIFSLIGAYNGGKCYMTTIKEIAKACNVSVATVSNVFTGKGRVSEERRQFILQTAKR